MTTPEKRPDDLDLSQLLASLDRAAETILSGEVALDPDQTALALDHGLSKLTAGLPDLANGNVHLRSDDSVDVSVADLLQNTLERVLETRQVPVVVATRGGSGAIVDGEALDGLRAVLSRILVVAVEFVGPGGRLDLDIGDDSAALRIVGAPGARVEEVDRFVVLGPRLAELAAELGAELAFECTGSELRAEIQLAVFCRSA